MAKTETKTKKKAAVKETKYTIKQQTAAKKPKKEEPAEKKPAKPKKKPAAEKKPKTGKKPAAEKPGKEKPAEEKTGAAPEEAQAEEKKEKPPKKKKKPGPKPVEKIKFTTERKLSDDEKSKIRRKPKFQRPETGIRKQVSDRWRRPRGIDSKQLEGKRGKGALPSPGYKKPNTLSGLVKGFKTRRVENPAQAQVADPNTEAIIIAATVGRKKRNEIIKIANEKKITILNPRKGEI